MLREEGTEAGVVLVPLRSRIRARGNPSGGYSGWRSNGSHVTATPNRRSSHAAGDWPTRQNGQM